MSSQQVIQLFQALPKELQQEVIDFMEFLQAKRKQQLTSPKPTRRPGTLSGFVVYMAPDFDAPFEDF